MKRWIHAASIPNQIKKITDAKKALDKFDPEKVEYVKECQDEIAKAISESYFREDDESPVGPKLSEIKRDYTVGALEDDFMTEEEFDEIFDLLDIVSIELASPYA